MKLLSAEAKPVVLGVVVMFLISFLYIKTAPEFELVALPADFTDR